LEQHEAEQEQQIEILQKERLEMEHEIKRIKEMHKQTEEQMKNNSAEETTRETESKFHVEKLNSEITVVEVQLAERENEILELREEN